jgi:hypothetical protein
VDHAGAVVATSTGVGRWQRRRRVHLGSPEDLTILDPRRTSPPRLGCHGAHLRSTVVLVPHIAAEPSCEAHASSLTWQSSPTATSEGARAQGDGVQAGGSEDLAVLPAVKHTLDGKACALAANIGARTHVMDLGPTAESAPTAKLATLRPIVESALVRGELGPAAVFYSTEQTTQKLLSLTANPYGWTFDFW